MNPSCKLPCYISSSSAKMLKQSIENERFEINMLQIRLKWQLVTPFSFRKWYCEHHSYGESSVTQCDLKSLKIVCVDA